MQWATELMGRCCGIVTSTPEAPERLLIVVQVVRGTNPLPAAPGEELKAVSNFGCFGDNLV
jgi:hypothetical protein